MSPTKMFDCGMGTTARNQRARNIILVGMILSSCLTAGAESLTAVTGLTIAEVEVGSLDAVTPAAPSWSSSAEKTFFNPASVPKVTRKLLQAGTGRVPGYYPSGVQLDVPEATITAGGWTICYDQPYTHQTTAADLTQCSSLGTFVLMGAKSSSGASNLTLLAAGASANALATTASLTIAILENGAYWYNYPGYSLGFAESSQLDLGYWDRYNRYSGCSQRLSWLLLGTLGGYRAGCTYDLHYGAAGATWRKLIYTSTAEPTSSPTSTRSPTSSPTTTSPTTAAPTSSPTTSSPTTVSPTIPPTSAPTEGPTSSPTSTRSPTTSPTTSSPTITRSPTTSPTTTSPTASPTGRVPGYYPSGVQLDVPEATITAGGWTICYDQPYTHQTTAADLTQCSSLGTFVLMGAKSSSGASNLTLLAAGASANALATTSSQTIAILENGAYWY
eukprot:CAMPEP_0198228726 /NCGR_PEP_ID=MMETSP1445-20131203/113749_1 /TAXON_ID=36898 /ORGANISM="Pyramimonas sp., Strain CCMP2087" /LENGTH=444 /DNA_ID=CAMNT_0043909145 /DNA_START=215 /DNA_END=1546 /DNA_ORIENTATION=+